ncbi:MAG: exopolysaccharide biosynthesis polyprenyl glycosylphosphotransferase [Agathobacter sp.]|nr:exopolysaccharide biosynthesis polyprenyl glycosylphosphotransferase [Agathobacter sp.]
MDYRERYKHLLNRIAGILMWAFQTFLFAYTWYQIYVPNIAKEDRFFNKGNWAVVGMYGLYMFFFTQVFGGYKIGYLRITEIVLSNFLAIICANVVEYFQLCLILNDYVMFKPLIIIALIEMLLVVPYVYIIRKLYVQMYPARKMLVIYGDYEPDDLIKKINTRKDKYNICGTISIEVGLEKLFDEIKQYKAIVLCDLPAKTRNEILKFCYRESIRTYVTPKISDVILRGAEDIHLFDTPLLLSRNQGLTIEQRFTKRTFDIVASLIGLIILSPFMLISAIIIKLYDGGPVFYTQERLTRDRKKFQIIKFRSMRSDSEAGGARLAMKDDDRVTPFGKLMRATHFDEIPQLINILKGDMSVVGPRPEREEIALQYEEVVPEFALRLKVKAGLTGYAQVYGKYNTTPYDKLKLDISYIEKYSFVRDLRLILMTIKVIFQKENSEGVDQNKKTALKS